MSFVSLVVGVLWLSLAACGDDGAAVCTSHDDCPGGRCDRGACVDAATGPLFPDATSADTGAVTTTDSGAASDATTLPDTVKDGTSFDAADTAGEATSSEDVAEVDEDAADDAGDGDDTAVIAQDTATGGDGGDTAVGGGSCDEGAFGYCPLDCATGQFPLRRCDEEAWGACACRDFTFDHFAVGGMALHGGMTGTAAGRILMCYPVEDQIIVAERVSPEIGWNVFPVSVFEGGAGSECDIEAGPGELVQLVYGEVDGNDRRLVHHTLNLQGNLTAAEYPQSDVDDNGHVPRVIVTDDGVVEVVAAAREGTTDTLEFYRRDGGVWTTSTVGPLPSSTYDQALARCGDTTVVSYLSIELTNQSWSRLAVGDGQTWSKRIFDQDSDRAGPAPSVACARGHAVGVFQNTTLTALRQFSTATPEERSSYVVEDIDFELAAGLYTDLRIVGDTIYLAWTQTTGEIHLAARPLDLSAPWRDYRVKGNEDFEVGALVGDVGLWVAPDGRPALAFFGAFGDAAGPWLATIEEDP